MTGRVTCFWRFIRGTWVPARLAWLGTGDLRLVRVILVSAMAGMTSAVSETVLLTAWIKTGDSVYGTAREALYWFTWLPALMLLGCSVWLLIRSRRPPRLDLACQSFPSTRRCERRGLARQHHPDPVTVTEHALCGDVPPATMRPHAGPAGP